MRHITNMAEAYKKIQEKLKPSDGAGAYIKDFRKSDAPQFKGKSDKKIQKMAIAAYLDDKEENMKIGDNESVNENKVFVVRYTDPQNKKRFAIPFKDQKSADDKADQLRKNFKGYGQKAVKSIKVTKDILKRGVKFKEQYEEKSGQEDIDMDPAKHVAKSKRNPDKFCVFDKDGNEVKLFDKKEDAIAYAKANHDELMGEKLDDKDTSLVKAVVAKLKKASGAHAGQAKDLQKAIDEGINPYVSMYRDKKNGKMVYDVLDKNEKSAFKTSNMKVAQDYLNKNYNKLKEENINEAKFAVKLMGIPGAIYIDAESAGKVKQKIRKMLRKPDDLISVERVLPTDFKADLRQRIKGVPSDDTEMAQKEEIQEKTEATDKQKRLQRAKDMNKFYDAQKKAALKGKNKKLAKKMLKNSEIDEAKFDEPEFSKKNIVLNKIGLVAQKKKELGKHTDESKKSPTGVKMGEGRRSKYDMDQDDEEGANKNIIMQLRKSVDLKGRFDVEFEDGKKVKVKDTIARAAVLKHAGFRRPAEKLAFQNKIEKSYRDLLNALKGR